MNQSAYINIYFNSLIYSNSELKAEVLRLRGVREGYEKQLGVIPRRLLDCMEPIHQPDMEVKRKQKEIDKLKDQLKKTEEQLAATQM